jgi:hypothetical protein
MIPPDPKSRIYTGDCREILASISDACVDAVITDPPYPEISRDYGPATRTFPTPQLYLTERTLSDVAQTELGVPIISSPRASRVCQKSSAVPVVPLVWFLIRTQRRRSRPMKALGSLAYSLFSRARIEASVSRMASMGSRFSEGGGRSR